MYRDQALSIVGCQWDTYDLTLPKDEDQIRKSNAYRIMKYAHQHTGDKKLRLKPTNIRNRESGRITEATDLEPKGQYTGAQFYYAEEEIRNKTCPKAKFVLDKVLCPLIISIDGELPTTNTFDRFEQIFVIRQN